MRRISNGHILRIGERRREMKRACLAVIIFFAAVTAANAFVLVSKSGKTYEWTSYIDNGNEYCTERGGGTICVPKGDIVSISNEEGEDLVISSFGAGVKQAASPSKSAKPSVDSKKKPAASSATNKKPPAPNRKG
jgi:hypothetical protein